MKKRKVRLLNLRIWALLALLVVFGFLVIIKQLYTIQIVDGDIYKARVLQQRTHAETISAKRGTIYDRNEKVLAQSATVWNVCISPAEITDEQWGPIASKLSEILEVPEDEVLMHKEKKETFYVIIKKGIDNTTRESIAEFISDSDLKIRGIFFEEMPKRFYTYDNLASTVLGFTDNDHHGAYGLESYFDAYLSGTPGLDVRGQGIETTETNQTYRAEDGHSIVLTIDEVIQSILEKHLEIALVEHNVREKATAIFMDIETGEILGLASKPDFNPNDPYKIADTLALEELDSKELDKESEEYKEALQKLQFDQWRNKAISDPYEPGSVYKIVTASIALEEQKSFLNDQFYCPGFIEVADRRMNCWLHSGHGMQDFHGITRNSCNPAFVMLGARNGAQTTRDYMADFGLGKVSGIDLPGEAEGILHQSRWGEVELASVSFGQSFKTTPIQMITATAAAINDGKLLEPHIVRQIMDAQGNVIETVQPEVKRQVISAETSAKIRVLLEEVVGGGGSGRHAAVPGYRIGGKTGTSEKLDLLPRKEYVLSFVGFAPMEKPKYACLVVLDEPGNLSNPLASVIAAPVVGAIFQESLPYLGVEPHYTDDELAQKIVKVPYLVGAKPHDAQAELTALGLKTKMIGQGVSVIRQVPTASEEILSGGVITLYCSEEDLNTNIIMPDLARVNGANAKISLHELGLNVVVEGLTADKNAVVGQQWPLPGEKLTSGDTVKITLIKDPGNGIETLPEIDENGKAKVPAEGTGDVDSTGGEAIGTTAGSPAAPADTPAININPAPPATTDPPEEDADTTEDGFIPVPDTSGKPKTGGTTPDSTATGDTTAKPKKPKGDSGEELDN